MIPWLNPATPPAFPPLQQALSEPDGLLAAGGALAPEWILTAYRQGIFPWFSEGDPILWWSPDPRMIIIPGEEKISRSLRKTLNSGRFEIRCNTSFPEVLTACAAPRSYARGTWILPMMQQAYLKLHELGWAHSIETWRDGQLVGGLYGLAIGNAFFGESMFHHETDASKVAFAHLLHVLKREQFILLDCQMSTPHLSSLGGKEVPRDDFIAALADATRNASARHWPTGFANVVWSS